MKAALYLRQSHDKTGDGLAVERQESECRRLCEYRGWPIEVVITDNDTSASVGTRAGFSRLLGLIESKSVDVVVVLRVDRLLRKMADLEQLIDLCERTGVKVVTVEGDLQLDTASGRLLGRILASVARAEVETKSARQILANRQKAEAGKPHGSRRCFGYDDDGMTVREDEALVLKDIAHRFLNGYSYRSLAAYLNERGITTSQGCEFFPITICNMLQRKKYAAIREYEGVEYAGQWPAIFDADTWSRIQYTIRQRKEAAGNRSVAKKYLLTGFLFCGACGGPLNGETKRDKPSRPLRKTYQCKGCHGVTRGSVPLEHFIRELVCYRLDTPDLSKLMGDKDTDVIISDLLERRASVATRLAALVDDYTDGTLTKPEYVRAKARAQKALEAVERDIMARHQADTFNGLLAAGESVRARWESESDGWKRQLVALLIERIIVRPGNTKPFYVIEGTTYRFDTELIDVEWRA